MSGAASPLIPENTDRVENLFLHYSGVSTPQDVRHERIGRSGNPGTFPISANPFSRPGTRPVRGEGRGAISLIIAVTAEPLKNRMAGQTRMALTKGMYQSGITEQDEAKAGLTPQKQAQAIMFISNKTVFGVSVPPLRAYAITIRVCPTVFRGILARRSFFNISTTLFFVHDA